MACLDVLNRHSCRILWRQLTLRRIVWLLSSHSILPNFRLVRVIVERQTVSFELVWVNGLNTVAHVDCSLVVGFIVGWR